jgi:basic membrane protein A and related proteins
LEEEQQLTISKRLLGLGASAAIVFAACGPGTASTAPATQGPVATAAPGSAAPGSPAASTSANKDYIACVAFDTGGLGDKGFNDLAKKGLDDAEKAGYTVFFSEAQGSTDYEHNIQSLIDKGCQTIVTVGFLQGSATAKATLANPTIAFAQVDATWNSAGDDFTPGTADDPPPGVPANFTGLDYQVDQASMLAGYLAAGWSKTGKIGTYGGLAFPGVTRFMDGLFAGIAYYNEKKAPTTPVQLIGWDATLEKPEDTGTFVGGTGGPDTWNDTGKGEQFAQNFIGQGVDIVHPVAGETGNGTIKAMSEAGKWAIGVDTDQYISIGGPTVKALLTSAQKAIDVSVLDVINKNASGDLGGEDYSGTIRNNGVLLAPYHDFESQLPAELKSEIEALKGQLTDGSITVCRFLGPIRGC